MNVHHLELFYFIARHGGIMPAVRNIPYGIQQPAVSAQVAQLEESLGVTLFRRRPFELTTEGEKLYHFIQPFFSNLDKMAAELQGGQTRHIRIGASTIILRDHLPDLFQAVRNKFHGLRISLREGHPAELEQLLEQEEIDLAITLTGKKPPAGLRLLNLIELPLILLVEKNGPFRSAADLWKLDRIAEPLICLPQAEVISRNFQTGLAKMNIDWFPGIEASSLDVIESYVANGLGIGVSVAIPGKALLPKVRSLPLNDFPTVILSALWRGRPTPLLQTFLDELASRARQLAG